MTGKKGKTQVKQTAAAFDTLKNHHFHLVIIITMNHSNNLII
jgi:hypothetical protein